MRLNDAGALNTFAKRVTPKIGRAVQSLGASDGVELIAAYLNVVLGKGAGTGWDESEVIAMASVLQEVCPSGQPVVIDCGANRGHWMRKFRLCFGSDGGRWIAIEPSPENTKHLSDIPNLEVVQAAVGEKAEKLQLYSDCVDGGWGSLHKRNDSFTKGFQFQTFTVPVITIDGLMEKAGLDHVDFLKMDIEGHELFALRGARGALTTRKIKALSFEFGSGNVNSRTFFRDFWEMLTPLRFELRRICPGGKTVVVKSYYEDLEAFRGVTNYVAILRC